MSTKKKNVEPVSIEETEVEDKKTMTTEELEKESERLKELLNKRKRIDKYKDSSAETANSLKAMYDAFQDVGFDSDKSWQLVIEFVRSLKSERR